MVEINPLLNAETAFNLLTPFGLIFLLLIGFWYVLPRLLQTGYLRRDHSYFVVFYPSLSGPGVYCAGAFQRL